MKKVICFAVFCIAALAVTSCGEKPVKGTNGMEYETYQQAVRNQDFEAAYIFLDRIENDEGKDNEKYITARDFIVGHELTYLASVNSEESTKRIIYLLTEMRPESKKIPIGNFGVGTVDNCQYNELKKQIDTYSLDVSNFNKQCHRILNLAITELICSCFFKFSIYHKQVAIFIFQHIPGIKVRNNNITICECCFIHFLKIKSRHIGINFYGSSIFCVKNIILFQNGVNIPVSETCKGIQFIPRLREDTVV